ncbi:MAG: heparan-alpha-glucosaminide N-acetyltransferase domain-containing protein [Vicinamibacteraceae bacterium]
MPEHGQSSTTAGARAYRLSSIDMLRGLAIVIMAIDHSRDFFMSAGELEPAANPSIGAALFFTRWITHFCAPTFVFLAGTSAGLMVGRKSRGELGRFLFSRGAWLVLIEAVIISTAWTFSPGGMEELGGIVRVPMQVIFAIGASMMMLAAAQGLGRRTCAWLGAAVVLGHNLLDPVWPQTSLLDAATSGPWWAFLHSQTTYLVGPILIRVTYPLLPWIGVMLLGFGTASVFEAPPARRKTLLLASGIAASVAFVLIRATGLYGDPNPWQWDASPVRAAIDFLNTTKYPPSLLFLLMTLGPAAILCALAELVPGAIQERLVTFGRAPFAFYVAHLYVLHAGSAVLGALQGFEPWQFLTVFQLFPRGYGLSLPGVYAVWVLVVIALYPLCRWVSAVKARRRDWWLSYL